MFRPDLVHLKGGIEENSARQGFAVSLNLRLPSGQMATQEHSPTATTAIKAAFDAITEQLKKHKELLRNQHRRPRRGPRTSTEAPFEQTLAAIKPELISSTDISGYIDVNLPRLKRFYPARACHRENEGQIPVGQLAVEDVVSEAMAAALGEQPDKPERMKLEPWIHRLAKQAISRLTADTEDGMAVPLERSHGQQNVQASDEARLQFHQPDDKLSEESVIADPTADNPEELAARHELISLVETTLRDAGRNEREAFILYTIEGFTLEEIADITNRKPRRRYEHPLARRASICNAPCL